MSVIYEKQLELSKRDYIKNGNSAGQWLNMMKISLMTIRDLGFSDNYDVRRVAEKYGRFT